MGQLEKKQMSKLWNKSSNWYWSKDQST